MTGLQLLLTRRQFLCTLAGAAAATTLPGGIAGENRSAGKNAEPFTIVLLPDTQHYSLRHPELFLAQTEWIKAHRERDNIRFVIHLGDITDKNTEAEWGNADKAMKILDGVVPYSVIPGNHDMTPGKRDTRLYNKCFPPERFAQEKWYGGHYGGNNDSNYCFFTAAGMAFMVLNLEFGPRDEVLGWANALVAKHRDKRVIVSTHCYMNFDDTRVGEGDKYNPHAYKPKGGCNDGEEMWDKFVRKQANIFLVVSGHILNDGAGRLTSKGVKGNRTHQFLANYQMKKRGGNGWLRTLKFVPAENRIQVQAYSPVLDKFNPDAEHEFTLDYPMTVTENSSAREKLSWSR